MKNVKQYFDDRTKQVHSGCIEWQGSLDGHGYGQIRCNSLSEKAHRYSYRYFKGKIPKGYCVCHKCDNPKCVNHEHLFIGTHSDNMRDMYEKGRANRPSGEDHKDSKLTWNKVEHIRISKKSSRELGKLYGVSHQTILAIRNNKTWKPIHLPEAKPAVDAERDVS